MPNQRPANTDSLDQFFLILSDPYRRRILTRLYDHNPRDEAELSADVPEDDADDSERLRLDIHHRHLPKLAEAGFIDWDRDADVITRGPRFHEIAPLIELMANHGDELPAGWP